MSFFATDGGISNFRTSNAFQTRGAQLTRQQPLGSLLDVITLGPTCYTTQDSRTALACLSATLPNFDQYWISYGPGSGNEYYSPAVCPSGYNVNTFDTTAWDTRLPAASGGETIGFCCKVTYRYGPFLMTRAPQTYISECATQLEARVFHVEPGIYIRWRDSDLSILETHPLTPGLRMTRAPNGNPTGQGSSPTGGGRSPGGDLSNGNQADISDSDTGGGLSKGARVGIGIGIVIIILLLVAAIFLFFRRRRSPAAPGVEVGEAPQMTGPQELPAKEAAVMVNTVPELHAQPAAFTGNPNYQPQTPAYVAVGSAELGTQQPAFVRRSELEAQAPVPANVGTGSAGLGVQQPAVVTSSELEAQTPAYMRSSELEAELPPNMRR